MQHSPLGGNQLRLRETAIEIGLATVIAAVAMLLLCGYVLRSGQYLLGDGLYLYQVFYNAFTQLTQTSAVPRWFPYTSFGITADLRQLTQPFLSIPVMEMAISLGVKNAWYAFLFTVAIDYWLTSIGIYLFVRQFASRAVSMIAAAALVWMTVIDNNMFFSLYTFITTPFTVLFLFLWAKHENPTHLMMAIVSAGLGSFLPTLYFAPYHAFAYIVIGLTLALAYRPRVSFPLSISFWIWAFLAVVVLTTVGYLAFSSIGNVKFFSTGRDADLHSSLHNFLDYGGGIVGVTKSLEPFVGVPLSGPNPLFFLTAIGIVFPIYAIWAGWSRDVAVLIFLFWFFLLFCWGPYTPIAPIAYYFPGMSYFRHVGYAFGFPKIFAIALTAIGLQRFIDHLQVTDGFGRTARFRLGLIVLIVSASSVGVAAWYIFSYQHTVPHSYYEPKLNSWLWLMLGTSLAGAPLVWWICRSRSLRNILTGIAALVLVQATIYQLVYTYTVFHLPLFLPKSLLETAPQPFEEQRTTDISSHPRGGIYNDIAGLITSDSAVFTFLQLDACFTPRSHADLAMAGVAELASKEFGGDRQWLVNLPDHYKSSPHNPFFLLSGCGVAKLQWVAAPKSAEVTVSEEDEWPADCARSSLCLQGPGTRNRLTIRWPGGQLPAATSLGSQGITADSFFFDRATFSLTVDQPGWLLYADAYDPRWSVRVDKTPAVSWQANFAYKAVHLEPGRHTVEWRFGEGDIRTPIFMAYQVLSTALITWLIIIAGASGGIRCGGNTCAKSPRNDYRLGPNLSCPPGSA
jgi:hypothetical protein